jgi:hypothetical protein
MHGTRGREMQVVVAALPLSTTSDGGAAEELSLVLLHEYTHVHVLVHNRFDGSLGMGKLQKENK